MLKKIKKAPSASVKWDGEVVAEVRGLSPADITNILVSVGDNLAGLFSTAEDFDEIKVDTKNPDKAADQLLAAWPKLVGSFATHLPDTLATIIANAADAPEEWEFVRDNYPMALQLEILVEIARLTFESPEGFRRFVGNALLLVNLGGTLTSGSKKRPKTRVAPPSSDAG